MGQSCLYRQMRCPFADQEKVANTHRSAFVEYLNQHVFTDGAGRPLRKMLSSHFLAAPLWMWHNDEYCDRTIVKTATPNFPRFPFETCDSIFLMKTKKGVPQY